MMQESAGCVLVQGAGHDARALVIRVRPIGFEIPKGHLEAGETAAEAAIRELGEETGLLSEVSLVANLGVIEYSFLHDHSLISKRVTYFTAVPRGDTIAFGAQPAETREVRWVSLQDMETLPLVNESLRSILCNALAQF